MTFTVLFLYLYGLFQLYALALRKTASVRSLLYLFLVGAFSCSSVAIAVQTLISHYWSGSTWIPDVHAAVEEIVKALPVFLLLFRTRAGATAGLLDGILYGAAVGAGFGFAEDTIYTMEHASLPGAYGPMSGILLSWLPGGWAQGAAFFPGHIALTALVGAGAGVSRKFWASRPLRACVSGAFLMWAIFLHMNFNDPPAATGSLSSWLYYQGNGGGSYILWVLLALIIGLLVMEEIFIRKRLAPMTIDGAPEAAQSKALFADLAIFVDGLGRGLAYLKVLRRLLRHKAELINARWDSEKAGTKAQASADALVQGLVNLIRNDAARLGSVHPAAQSSLPELRTSRNPLSAWRVIYWCAIAVVGAYSFWFVFLGPFFDHGDTTKLASSTWMFLLGLLGQALFIWQLVNYLKVRKQIPEPFESSAVVIARCRGLLAWTGGLICISAFKQLYDVSQFPYPFRPANILDNWNQLNSCYGAASVSRNTGGWVGPLAPVIEPPKPYPDPEKGTVKLEEDDFFTPDPPQPLTAGAGPKPDPILNRPLGESPSSDGGRNGILNQPLGDPSDLKNQ